ncbi:MAG: sigma-E processing peptidase SpoIIGA [Christensenellales bacterium]
MQVYVEVVLLVNILIGGFILALTEMLVKCKVSFVRVCLGALIGAIFAVVYPYVEWSGLWLVKIALALVMVAVGARYNSLAHYFSAIMVFFAITFLLGGVAIGSSYIFGKSIFDSNGYVSLFVGLGLVFVLCSSRIIWKHFVLARRKKHFSCQVLLVNGDVKLTTTAFCDSGNRLYYRDYRPVMMIDKDVYQTLYQDDDTHKMSMKVNTVNGKSEIELRELDQMIVLDSGKSYRNVVVGVSKTPLGEYGMLLHSEI